jgi:hypothetical protein
MVPTRARADVQRRFFEICGPLHGCHQIWHEIGTPLVLVQDLRPGRLGALFLRRDGIDTGQTPGDSGHEEAENDKTDDAH